jgi:NAD(P)-dependent dehydrogenase (short-subunit alcohol dehydrogenase family)
MARLEGSVALITGIASGIGAACAGRFAREGARIAGLDVQKPPDAVWRSVVGSAPDAFFQEADVRDEGAIERAVAAAAERFGRIDSLVHAAGVHGIGGVDSLEAAEWDRVVDVNLKGSFLVAKHVVRRMLARRAGSIVLLASIEGLEGMPQQAAYNASKAGVILLARNMAADYGPFGIRVNCLCPGLVDTPMTEGLKAPELAHIRESFVAAHLLGRAGRPEEIAAAALFLASEDASFVTGAALVVDGGFTAARRILPS